MELLIGIGFLIGGFVALWKTAAWILRPLDEAARGRELPMQFTLGDFLGLVFLMQVPTWALLLDRRMAWPIVVFGWIAFGLMWLFGVHTLSRAGVENPWHRVLFVAVVIPGSVCGTIAVIPLIIGSLMLPMMVLRGARVDSWLPPVMAAMGLGGVLYGLGRLTRWMLAGRSVADSDRRSMAGRADDLPPAPPDPFADDDDPTVMP